MFVPAENSGNCEKPGVLASAAAVSPACSRSCVYHFRPRLPIPESAVLELEALALRHQLNLPRRQ